MSETDCKRGDCGFGLYSEYEEESRSKGSIENSVLGCDSGNGSCWAAYLVEADTSSFHDEQLQYATRHIKAILNSIPEDSDGRKLSFVHTRMGTLLAWVQHGVTFPKGTLTIDSDPHELAAALGLRLPDPPTAA